MFTNIITAENATQKNFDYIFLGAGVSSLSIICRLLDDAELSKKYILIIDSSLKDSNDKTWSFWQNKPNYFQHLIAKSWNNLLIINNDLKLKLDTGSYNYNTIHSIDFYSFCINKINTHKNIFFVQDSVMSVQPNEIILFDGTTINCNKTIVFNSIYKKPKIHNKQYYLLQHFMGWFIETKQNFFDSETATLMDFSVTQNYGTAFVYVLPFTANRAMIEFTLFSENLLHEDEYEEELKKYIELNLNIKEYTITQKEFGIIPMTNYNFKKQNKNIIYIGSQGGNTKASTGYTFTNIQKQSNEIVQQLKQNNSVQINDGFWQKRFNYYDSILLQILAKNKLSGADVFTRLFQKNKGKLILKFLDNATNFWEEIKIMNSTQRWAFTKAAITEIFK